MDCGKFHMTSDIILLLSTSRIPAIDHLQARTKELINMLIAVTSRLDVVDPSMNVLNHMENRWCVTFKRMLWFNYTVHVNFANSNRSMIYFHALSCLLEANHTYWLWVTVQSISGLWWIQLKTKAIWLVVFALYAISILQQKNPTLNKWPFESLITGLLGFPVWWLYN